ncbi:hypothetical protein LINPERHAP2_LOCUS25967, partial [Linum perenne]
QIKDIKVSLEHSDGRFGSICRLVVSKGVASHFIFLDRSLVLWLEGALQVASSSSWNFPSPCKSGSIRRSLVVSSVFSSSGRVLKISEVCRNSKVFFVLIPMDTFNGGWWSFLKLLQSYFIRSCGKARLMAQSSFAQIVKGIEYSTRGRCVGETIDGSPGVLIEEDRVSERIRFLDCCIVIRFCTQEQVDWVSFRRWAHRQWGTAIDWVSFRRLASLL